MIGDRPAWTLTSNLPLTQWNGHVHLLPDKVLGQWFVAERKSGELVWQRRILRANSIRGIASGVIVASEMRSDGPWTFDFGCYGISLEDGRLVWVSHREGAFGIVTRLLDFVPMFTNELRDSPHHVLEGKVYCESGRVLDALTGELLGWMKREEIAAFVESSPTDTLFSVSMYSRSKFSIQIEGKNISLSSICSNQRLPGERVGFLAEDEDGKLLWRFSIEDGNNPKNGNLGSCRLLPPFLYLLASDEWRYCKIGHKNILQSIPTHWHLLTLDLRNGEIRQELALGTDRHLECRIDDGDSTGLLVSKSPEPLRFRELTYFERIEQALGH